MEERRRRSDKDQKDDTDAEHQIDERPVCGGSRDNGHGQ